MADKYTVHENDGNRYKRLGEDFWRDGVTDEPLITYGPGPNPDFTVYGPREETMEDVERKLMEGLRELGLEHLFQQQP